MIVRPYGNAKVKSQSEQIGVIRIAMPDTTRCLPQKLGVASSFYDSQRKRSNRQKQDIRMQPLLLRKVRSVFLHFG